MPNQPVETTSPGPFPGAAARTRCGDRLSAAVRRLAVGSAVAGAIAGGAVLGPLGVTPASAATMNLGSCLAAGHVIHAGQYLAAPGVSSGGRRYHPYKLIMQSDGNLVAYTAAWQPLWASETGGNPGAYAVLQSGDGNFVVYSSAGQALWADYAPTSPGDRVCVQGDGNVVSYSAGNSPLWATMTNVPAGRGQTLGANPGAGGQCTWWAEQEFAAWTGTYADTLGINGTSGNAAYWAYNAAERGWSVGSTPRAGSIAVFAPGVAGAGSVGHVAWVTEVYPAQNAIVVSEMNFEGLGVVDSRRISPAFGVGGLQYIYANP